MARDKTTTKGTTRFNANPIPPWEKPEAAAFHEWMLQLYNFDRLIFDRLRIARFSGRRCVDESELAGEFDAWLEDAIPKVVAAEPRVDKESVASREAVAPLPPARLE